MAEDAAAERELSDIGYRGRLLTELAANAADAAVEGDGCLSIACDGTILRFANTGVPLTRDGVESLTALRVSPKASLGGQTVGHFGVGFRSTAFADRVTVASTSGSIEFDRQRSAAEIGSDDVPAQRLAWPSDAVPPTGFTTQVAVDAGSAAAALYAGFAEQVPDLLLELPALRRIDVGEESFERRTDGDRVDIVRNGETLARWLVARAGSTSWMVPTRAHGAGGIVPLDDDVLRSPTATAVHLSLPARVITNLPLTPDRRDVHPDADVASAAAGYTDLVALAPTDQKHHLIPRPTLPAGRTAARLHEQILADLRVARWAPTVGGDALAPERVWVLPGLPDGLGSVLADVLDPLAHPDLSHPAGAAALVRSGARQIGLADLADELSAVDREPSWWRSVYAELAVLVQTGDDAAELGALPIPRADGRTHRGARGLFVLDELVHATDRVQPPNWLPLVHPDAYDPLLDRLGLEHCGVADALADPALRAAIDTADSHDELSAAVLDLIVLGDLDDAPGLGALELRADDGDDWPADELLLPDAPLRAVLVADSPFGSLDQSVVDRYGPKALRALGVGWGFAVVHDDLATGPDHDLPDEEQWWETHEVPPETVDAVRDLDLVDPNRWRDALALLADDATAPLLAAGYTRWWLRRYAEIDATPLRNLRSVDDTRFAGLFDTADDVPAAASALLVGGIDETCGPDDTDDAQSWLDRLGDPDRTVAPGVAARAHAALVAAVGSGRVDVAALDPIDRARTLAGTVTDTPIIVDRPWWASGVPADRAVLSGPTVDAADAAVLAEILDADLASHVCRGGPVGDGVVADADSAEIVALAATTGRILTGRVVVHRPLTVAVVVEGDQDEHRFDVPHWVDGAGTVHVSVGR
ncbi:sacsin N-terminal ATP-binding-like domain-containing protein [Gordonia sp. MP11Mi]